MNKNNNKAITQQAYIQVKVKERTYPLNKEVKQIDFLQAFVNNHGLIFKTCTQMNMKYNTYRRWMKDPKFKDRMDTAQQRVNELVEQSLINKFSTNSPVPEIFYLRSRDSRYNQNVILQGDTDKPITITYNEDTLKLISKAVTSILKQE